jgi:hypothetical protein
MLRVLHTPVTCAPSDLAIRTAKVPMPPEAPVDQDRLPRPDVAVIAKRLKRDEAGQGNGCGLLEWQVGGLQCQRAFGNPPGYSA